MVNRRRQQEAEQQVRRAAREASQAHPAVRRLVEENAALAETRKLLAAHIVDATAQLEQVNRQLTALTEQFTGVQEKVDDGRADQRHRRNLLRRQRENAARSPRRIASNVACGKQTIGEGQLR